MNDRPRPPLDDNPEWTEGDFAKARPSTEVHGAVPGLTRPRGRPAMDEAERKQQVTMRLSPDVLAALRATGRGWQARADDILRDALMR